MADAAADTFVAVLGSWSTYRSERGSVASWLYGIARNAASDRLLGQPEVPAGVIPGGGAIERLPGLVGRARTIEIVIGGDDFDAKTAETYGWVNRVLSDEELDAFVDILVRRIASFDS